MNKREKSDLLLIPNLMSIFRIILIPAFVYSYYTKNPFIYADLFIICLSFLTDVLDGKIARKYNMISELGKIIDPLADKLTQFTVLIVLYLDKRIPWILPSMIFIKEMFMLAGAIYIRKDLKKNVLPSNWWGKSATGTFYFSAALYLLNADHIAIYFLLASIILIFVAFATYLIGFLSLKNKNNIK